MTKIKDLHRTWTKDAAYRREYDALEEEFTVMAAIAEARRRAGLSQAELARRMKTTQSTVARLESGRGQPSTRASGVRPAAVPSQPAITRGRGSAYDVPTIC